MYSFKEHIFINKNIFIQGNYIHSRNDINFKEIILIQGNMFIQGNYIHSTKLSSRTTPEIFIQQISPSTLQQLQTLKLLSL